MRDHHRDDIDASLDLLLDQTPFMDVRAPVEFEHGAIPGAVNVPILDDDQRAAIGTRYKEAGQEAAIELGLELATPDIRTDRLEAWSRFASQNSNGYLYCFRGGLRSNTTQAWLREAGIHYPLVRGGYKALRRVLIDAFSERLASSRLQLLAGPTGSGKTEVIQAWPVSLDLEGRANHRGSAFGATFTPQPAQIDWENQISLDWARLDGLGNTPVLLEDEAHLIGRIHLVPELHERMQTSPVIVLEALMQERVERLLDDYVNHALQHFRQQNPQNPWPLLGDYVSQNLHRIRKRLGGLRHDQLQQAVPEAVEALARQSDPGGFHRIIETLLTDYYDPMYRYQLNSRDGQILFRGDHSAILSWLDQQSHV
ncbi:tRNA 2-selenouridine(34) synthase MnmH [Saccharospirillum impatiens]|uniref:tRNA 2-selenouridine(34) synthase MnmH n=1 Tax=Saccharospirillum impatiens TaxID=169438 RepID=UPI00041C054F|nr:tRNA 2-selenouridine(34) synthase MnmH [Saccharospirillum impatiens]